MPGRRTWIALATGTALLVGVAAWYVWVYRPDIHGTIDSSDDGGTYVLVDVMCDETAWLDGEPWRGQPGVPFRVDPGPHRVEFVPRGHTLTTSPQVSGSHFSLERGEIYHYDYCGP